MQVAGELEDLPLLALVIKDDSYLIDSIDDADSIKVPWVGPCSGRIKAIFGGTKLSRDAIGSGDARLRAC